MSQAADVRDLDVLREWLAQLTTFREDAGEALSGLRIEFGRAVEWVREQQQLWQRELRKLEDAVVLAKNELAAKRFPDFSGRMPDTTVEERRLARAKAALDIYAAGTMSTPFASAGKTQGFADYNARTLIQLMRTMSALRPRAAILENGQAILHQRHRKQLTRFLSAVNGYRLKIFNAVDNRKFGIPHHRVMVYFVFIRVDALAVDPDAA